MASSGKKGKKTKGKVVPWQEFIATQTPAALPIRKGSSWADEVESDDNFDIRPRPALPSGPRASREVDDSAVPHQPPYIAYVSNLPYDIEEDDLRDLFADMQIESLRIPRDDRDGEGGRTKGFGYVEFSERSGLVGAISIVDPVVKARRVRIEVANENERRRGGNNRDRDRGDMNRSDVMHDPERTTGNWRQGGGTGPPPVDSPSNRGSNYRNNDRDRDRERDGPTESNTRPGAWRDSNERSAFHEDHRDSRDRPSFRSERGANDRNFNRDDRNFSRDDRDRFSREDRFSRGEERFGGERRLGGGFGPRRNYDDRNRDEPRREDKGEPRTRPKLQLAPRSIPLEKPSVEKPEVKEETKEEKSPSQNIFGAAKPVDTASRERQIESRLEKERELKTDTKAGGDTKENDRKFKKTEIEDHSPKLEMQGNDERRTNNKEISRAQNKIDNRKHEKREVRDSRTDEERMPKLKEQQTPNFAGSNKYAFLENDSE
ncbi:eukaryotic translation initiation factor 4B-like [Ctenocephalides felis]|uniref:eukaryotic translation initiation factor 4B-like n=1 Tax=Ctenocephalides felis TaxID=7515 RepID=UPI000E6E1BAF|nr:eukaryotic translation initiation factor 4B-like [Ctenocephalides felis]